jgi:Adenylate kinase
MFWCFDRFIVDHFDHWYLGMFISLSRFVHFSSGDLLRKEVLSGSKRGMQLYKLMELGELVPTVNIMIL